MRHATDDIRYHVYMFGIVVAVTLGNWVAGVWR